MFFIERLSSLWRLKCTNIIGKGPQIVSFIERLSSLWRLKCTSIIENRPQSVSFIERFFLLCPLFRVSFIRSSTVFHIKFFYFSLSSRADEAMQVMPSEAVSQGPVPVPEQDPSSQHGMETADTERSQTGGVMREGEGEGVDEEVITVHVESSESLQPSTSQELVKPVSEPVQQEAGEMSAEAERGGVVGGEEGESGEDQREKTEMVGIDKDSLQTPLEQV